MFAKLLDGKSIDYKVFLWNRALRLFPLLVVVILIVGILRFMSGGSMYPYLHSIARGAFYPSLPNGGWSNTVEFHYYAILPLFLWMFGKSKLLPISIIVVAIALCVCLPRDRGNSVPCLLDNCWPN